jgi:hypothetical protein
VLANLVIIKAAIISCTSTCDHVTGPYRLVHCRQPSGSTSTVHIASLFGDVDTRHYACNMDTVNCGRAFLQTEDLFTSYYSRSCSPLFLSLPTFVTPKNTLYWNGFPEFTNWSILRKKSNLIFIICDYGVWHFVPYFSCTETHLSKVK